MVSNYLLVLQNAIWIALSIQRSHSTVCSSVSREWQRLYKCTQQINDQGNPVHVYSISDTAARADNVPAACMDLATVILSDPAQAGGPVPTPMGSSSLQYNGLSSKDKTDLQNALSKTGSRT
ncbi:hypothetical protein N7467_002772 [Penicillium canescens]|nr:hypothetical protein N7467_002772 [Penicillium canescens]